MTLHEREHDFIKEVANMNGDLIGVDAILNKSQLFDFIEYWTETNQGGRKMRFEKEKTWNTVRRLKRWARNDKKWNPAKTVNIDNL